MRDRGPRPLSAAAGSMLSGSSEIDIANLARNGLSNGLARSLLSPARRRICVVYVRAEFGACVGCRMRGPQTRNRERRSGAGSLQLLCGRLLDRHNKDLVRGRTWRTRESDFRGCLRRPRVGSCGDSTRRAARLQSTSSAANDATTRIRRCVQTLYRTWRRI